MNSLKQYYRYRNVTSCNKRKKKFCGILLNNKKNYKKQNKKKIDNNKKVLTDYSTSKGSYKRKYISKNSGDCGGDGKGGDKKYRRSLFQRDDSITTILSLDQYLSECDDDNKNNNNNNRELEHREKENSEPHQCQRFGEYCVENIDDDKNDNHVRCELPKSLSSLCNTSLSIEEMLKHHRNHAYTVNTNDNRTNGNTITNMDEDDDDDDESLCHSKETTSTTTTTITGKKARFSLKMTRRHSMQNLYNDCLQQEQNYDNDKPLSDMPLSLMMMNNNAHYDYHHQQQYYYHRCSNPTKRRRNSMGSPLNFKSKMKRRSSAQF